MVGSRVFCASAAIILRCSMTDASAITTTPLTPSALKRANALSNSWGKRASTGMRLQAQDADGILYLPQRESHGWVAGITHDANTPYLRNHLDQQLRLFGTQIGREVHKAGDIPAWPRQTADKARAHRVSDSHHDDRNSGGR